MSEEMARKKKDDIEQFAKKEQEVLQEIAEDRCPVCKLPTSMVEFLNVGLVKTFGWVECTRCGTVYCPKSIMKQKRVMAASGVIPTIQPPIETAPSNLVIE